MRLLITGKTRSGKSTTLHRLLSETLNRDCWLRIILLDGKGVELNAYGNLPHKPHLTYYGPNELDRWADILGFLAIGLEKRYQQLNQRGLREAAPDDKRNLLIIDEVQVGCRDKENGRFIKQHLTRIAEQSAALRDVVIITCQREQNSVPPAVRWNCSAKLRLMGNGYFHYQPDGRPHIAGKIPYLSLDEAFAHLSLPTNDDKTKDYLTTDSLLDLLQAHHSNQSRTARANATLYLGADGSAKTCRLQEHPGPKTTRRIYADLLDSHRTWLLTILESCGATPPTKTTTTQLAILAMLAIQAEPTTLLLDNIDHANVAARKSILTLINATEICALAARPPDTPTLERKINPLISRCAVIRISPLTTEQAAALADQELPPDIPRRAATLRRIVDMGSGHPATIVNLCRQAKRGTLRELRHLENAPKRFNLVWLLLIPILILIIIWRYRIDSYMASALLLTLLMLLRPIIYRSVRQTST